MAVATAAAVVSTAATAYSAYQGKKAGDRQERAMDQQAAAQQRGIDVQEEHLDWARGQYDSWKQEFDPILNELKMEAAAGRTPDYAAITADTMASFASARNQVQREQTRYGIKPGEGQWGATDRRMATGQATAEIGARQEARRGAEDDRFDRLGKVYGIGANLQQGAMRMASGAYQGLSGAHGQQAGMFGDQAGVHGGQADMYGNVAAESGAAAFGQWADIIDSSMGGGGHTTYRGGATDPYGQAGPNGIPWAGSG